MSIATLRQDIQASNAGATYKAALDAQLNSAQGYIDLGTPQGIVQACQQLSAVKTNISLYAQFTMATGVTVANKTDWNGQIDAIKVSIGC